MYNTDKPIDKPFTFAFNLAGNALTPAINIAIGSEPSQPKESTIVNIGEIIVPALEYIFLSNIDKINALK